MAQFLRGNNATAYIVRGYEMKVSIDDILTVECSGLLNGGERWNGFDCPVFTAEQLEPIRQWWNETYDSDPNKSDWACQSFDEEVTDLGNDEYLLEGWVWQVTCDGCDNIGCKCWDNFCDAHAETDCTECEGK